jgi:hypothetical protein
MSSRQPKEIREKRALLKKDRYFKLLAEKCASFGASRDLAYLVHMSALQVIGQELNRHGVVRIPHVGTIALVDQKSRVALAGKAQVRMPARKILKVYPDYVLRRIYNAKQNNDISVYRHTRGEISL